MIYHGYLSSNWLYLEPKTQKKTENCTNQYKLNFDRIELNLMYSHHFCNGWPNQLPNSEVLHSKCVCQQDVVWANFPMRVYSFWQLFPPSPIAWIIVFSTIAAYTTCYVESMRITHVSRTQYHSHNRIYCSGYTRKNKTKFQSHEKSIFFARAKYAQR